MKKSNYKRAEVPMISVNPNYISLYTDCGQFTGRGKSEGAVFIDPETLEITHLGRTAKQLDAEQHLKNNDTNGIISNKASKRINQALSWFAAMSERREHISKNNVVVKNNLSFITLTLSSKQAHEDQYIKNKLLNAFLVDIRRRFFVFSYLWRAEAQVNGNIHFHIVINRYIHHSHIRKIWNRIQAEHGYIKNYDDKAARGSAANPPSTEIKAVYKCKNLAGYLSKYCTKNLNAMYLHSNITPSAMQQVVKASGKKDAAGVPVNPGLLAAKFIKEENRFILKFDAELISCEKIVELVQATGAIVLHYKDCELRSIKGRQWYCSTTLSQMKNVSEVVSDDVETDLQNILQRGCIKYTKIVKDYVTVLCFNVFEYVQKGMFEGFRQMIRSNQNKWLINEHEAYFNLLKA